MKTGKELWEDRVPERPQRIGRDAWGSMVHVTTPAGARLYVTDRGGTTLVYAAGPKYELLAANRLGEHTDASIAVSDGDIFIRTHQHLWSVGTVETK